MRHLIIILITLLLGCGSIEHFELDAGEDGITDPVVEDSVSDPIEDDAGTDPVEDPIEDPTEEDVTEEETVDLCGNGSLDTGEQCDNSGTDCDGCSNECLAENAVLNSGGSTAAASERVESGGAWGPGVPRNGTWSAWIKPTARYDGWSTIIEQSLSYSIGIHTERAAIFWAFVTVPLVSDVHKEVAIPYGEFEVNTWNHLEVTRDQDDLSGIWTVKTFWNGSLIDTEHFYITTSTYNVGGNFYIGGRYEEPIEWPYTGLIDDVHVAGEALHTGDFTPESRVTPGPDTKALWTFNEINSGRFTDISGNGFDISVTSGSLAPDQCHTP